MRHYGSGIFDAETPQSRLVTEPAGPLFSAGHPVEPEEVPADAENEQIIEQNTLQNRLWDEAYDKLRSNNSNLVSEYEEFIMEQLSSTDKEEFHTYVHLLPGAPHLYFFSYQAQTS